MRIETSAGKTFDVRAICPMLRNKNRIMIELEDGRPIADIIADFDGLGLIKKMHDDQESIYEAYEGFSRLVGIQKIEAGIVRLTLERGDAG